MKTRVDMKTPNTDHKLPFIGINNFSAAVILFTATVAKSFGVPSTMIKGTILEPGASEHSVGHWVTYERRDVSPLVGTITLEN